MSFAPSRCVLFSLLAPILVSAATAIPSPLTVLVEYEAPHSETSLHSMSRSLNHLLGPGGYSVEVRLKSELGDNPQFGQLVVFKMKGSCSMAAEPEPAGPIYDERGPLALAYTSDGEVLHFGEVECDRIRHSLQRVLGRNTSPKSQQTFGTALAVVIAHEVYHMLGNVSLHTHKGLTRPALSAFDLMDSRVALPPNALATIESASLPRH